MSSPSTLYSKLKVLVAKLYKAEKLYSSMKRVHTSERAGNTSLKTHASKGTKVHQLTANLSRINNRSLDSSFEDNFKSRTIDTNLSNQSLIEHANEVRSHEWFKVHHYFRIKLNTVLSEGNSSELSEKIENLWMEFLAEFEIAELDLQECSESAKDSLAKEEYSYLFKLSSELIKRKARLQALKVIHDELNNLISPAGFRSKNNYASLNEALQNTSLLSANVIPLKRNVAN